MPRKKKRKGQPRLKIEREYYDDVTFECPARGTVTERVLVKRYQSKMTVYKQLMRTGYFDSIDGSDSTSEEEE